MFGNHKNRPKSVPNRGRNGGPSKNASGYQFFTMFGGFWASPGHPKSAWVRPGTAKKRSGPFPAKRFANFFQVFCEKSGDKMQKGPPGASGTQFPPDFSRFSSNFGFLQPSCAHSLSLRHLLQNCRRCRRYAGPHPQSPNTTHRGSLWGTAISRSDLNSPYPTGVPGVS